MTVYTVGHCTMLDAVDQFQRLCPQFLYVTGTHKAGCVKLASDLTVFVILQLLEKVLLWFYKFSVCVFTVC